MSGVVHWIGNPSEPRLCYFRSLFFNNLYNYSDHHTCQACCSSSFHPFALGPLGSSCIFILSLTKNFFEILTLPEWHNMLNFVIPVIM